MRLAVCALAVLILPVMSWAETSQRMIFDQANLDSPPLEKLSSSTSQISLAFRMAGIETNEVTENATAYNEITPISGQPERFGETAEEGFPDLPVFAQLVAIPDQAGVRVEIISSQYEVVEDIDIYPSQPFQHEGVDEKFPFTKNEEFYQRDEFYPSEVVQLGEPIICRDLRMIQTTVNPVQYNPVKRQLRVYTNVDYRLAFDGGDSRNIKIRRNNRIAESFLPLYRSMVPNADEILADYQPVRGGYLILTPNSFADSIQALARWKHLKGYSVVVTRATDIDPDGSLTSAQIFNYIQNAYQTWDIPPEFVCIVGDRDLQFPDYPYGGYNSDHHYSCVEGSDYFSDVMVTRMSVPTTLSIMSTTMRKAIKYEKDPYMGDPGYWLRGLSVAGNVLAVTPRLTTLWVRSQLLRHGFTQVDTSFRWNSGEVDPQLPGYFNNGVGIISYRGWAGSSGWYCPSFDVNNLDALQANNEMGIMASLVCGTGNFGASECFGEKWIRMGSWPNALKGGPGFYGVTDPSTHTKWNNPIMVGYYWAILEEGIYNFATAAFRGKMELYETYPRHNYPGSYVEQYFNTYNTLGDPELELRTDIPQTMTVTYPASMPVGSSVMTINAVGSHQIPLANAYVNLVKGYGANEEVFVGGRTDAGGNITLDFSTTVADTMFVTVTARNYIAHAGFALVQAQPVAVNVGAVALDDDTNGNSSGNNDGNANPSETIELTVTLRNFGNTTTATNVSATLVSGEPDIIVTVPAQTYPDIPPGGTSDSPGEFAAQLVDNIPHGEHFILQLNITSDQGSWTGAIPIDVKSMLIATTSITYPNNSNNRLDPGETSQLVVSLQNLGELAGTAVGGILSTPDTGILILDNQGTFGNIPIGGSASNSGDPFTVRVSSAMYHGRNINFILELTSSNGSVANRPFSVVVGNVNTFDPLGPDGHDYYLYDNTDGGYIACPIYNWVEISPYMGGSGTRITFPLSTDDDAMAVSLPFNFVYYGQSFNYMLVSINGFVAFDTSAYDMQRHHWYNFDNNQMPEAGAPRGLIAPFWDDLEYTNNSGNYGVFKYDDAIGHRFIIEWKACTHPQAPGHHPETFQMIIYDPNFYPTPTGDSEILFQYQVVYNDDTDDWDTEAPGLYCTVGIQNLDNNDGLQYTYDNLYHPAAATLQAGRAIKVTTVTGLQEPPDIAYDPASFLVAANQGQVIRDTLTISNVSGGLLAFTLNEYADVRQAGADRHDEIAVPAQVAPIGHVISNDPKTDDNDEPIFPPSILNHGGPDGFGNHWIDSDDPGGPVYSWVDISGVGTPVIISGDDGYVGPITMGITFPFYGVDKTSVYINANGLLTFDGGTGVYNNQGIPNSSSPNDFVAMLWDDLSPQNGGSVYYYHDTANDRFIVSFANVPFYSGGGNLTFEVILYSNGRILMEYGTLDGGTRGLNSATVGIENSSGTDGLQVVYDGSYLHSDMAILYYAPPTWLISDLHSGFLTAGQDTFATITFDATDLNPGVYTGHLDLDSNDPDEGSVNIPITLTVGGQSVPDLSFSPSSISDTLIEGQMATWNLYIRNRGSASLIVGLIATEFNLAGDNWNNDIASTAPSDRPSSDEPSDVLNTWLFVWPAADTIAPGDSIVAIVTLDARFIGNAYYSGQISLSSNDPDSPSNLIPVSLEVFPSGPEPCSYTPGDMNDNGVANGVDVSYGVNYFKGFGPPPPVTCFDCPQPGQQLYGAGDVNSNCQFNGVDITYFVNYLKGIGPELSYCANCPPAGLFQESRNVPADAGD